MAESKIELVVDGIDLDDESTDITLAECFPGMLWGSKDGIVTVTQIIESTDSVFEASNLARRIIDVLDARAIRWNDDFVGYAEIARRSDVTSEAVRLWATGKRGPKTFPHPRGYVGMSSHRSPIWRWSDVSIWLDAEMHLGDGVGYPTDEQIAMINHNLVWMNSGFGNIKTYSHAAAPSLRITAHLSDAKLPVVNVGPERVRSWVRTS
jgi:hypothetical protein